MTFRIGASRWLYSDDMPDEGRVYLRLDEKGRVVELYLRKEDGGEVTTADLRAVPLTQTRARASTRNYMAFRTSFPDLEVDVFGELSRAFPYSSMKDQAPQTHAFELSPSSPQGGLTDDFLRDVAAAYRDALARGVRPNVALAEQAQCSKRTVEKWVWLARKKGFLDPTSPGRVG